MKSRLVKSTKEPALAGAPFKIPPILLEGDEPARQLPAPAEQPPLGPTPAAPARVPESASLPEAYGTEKLTLLARDPHWLYAHWDLTQQQQRQYNALSINRHLVLRVRPGTLAGHAATEVHVHPESRSWFIHVEGAAKSYLAELGYYPVSQQWVTVAASAPATTPPDTISLDRTLRFATIPPEAPMREQAVPTRLPAGTVLPPPEAPQQPVLAELIQRLQAQQRPAGSAEIPELLRGPIGGAAPAAPLALAAPASAPTQSISSPAGGEAKPPKAFWLNVNAELVLYGGTEPDASLPIGGKPIALRPDGTFSFRFALPDGTYELTVSALSTQGDSRHTQLTFIRRTEHQGEVGAAAQDPSLKAPAAENL